MPGRPKSLVELCTHHAIRNIGAITSIGDLPFRLAKPILRRITNPDQLAEIEMSCPELMDEFGTIWQHLIEKEFAAEVAERRYVPKNPRSWRKIYYKYRRERERDVAEAERRLMEQFDQLKRERARNETTILRQSDLPARMRRDGVVVNGNGGPRRSAGARAGDSGNSGILSWTAGSRTKMTTGSDVLRRARREAREAHRRAAMSAQLHAPRGQISRAPQAMVNDRRIALNPDVRTVPPAIKAPTRPQGVLANGRTEMEARLLRIKGAAGGGGDGGGAARPAPNPSPLRVEHKGPVVEVSDEEDEREEADYYNYDDDDDDDDGDDELFGDSHAVAPTAPRYSSASKSNGSSMKSAASAPPASRKPARVIPCFDDIADDDLFGEGPPISSPPSSKTKMLGPQRPSAPRGTPVKNRAAPAPGPASSPPASTTTHVPSASLSGLNRKRKAPVDIFMRKKK